MEQLSGLDASFLYLETPTLHMHVEMVAVFDPSTVPGGYSLYIRSSIGNPTAIASTSSASTPRARSPEMT